MAGAYEGDKLINRNISFLNVQHKMIMEATSFVRNSKKTKDIIVNNNKRSMQLNEDWIDAIENHLIVINLMRIIQHHLKQLLSKWNNIK